MHIVFVTPVTSEHSWLPGSGKVECTMSCTLGREINYWLLQFIEGLAMASFFKNGFWVTPGSAQEILVLFSGITPGMLRRPSGMPGIGYSWLCIKTNALFTVILPQPQV